MRWFVLTTTWLLTAALCRAQDPHFGLSLSVNGGLAQKVLRGQPLLVETLLLLEEGDRATVALNNNAPWTNALALQLRSRDGTAVSVTWSRLQAANGPMNFTSDATEITAILSLDESATMSLQPGEYLLMAVLDTKGISATGAWAGTIRSRDSVMVVIDEPPELDRPGQILKSRLRARWLQLSGQVEPALAELDKLLERFPEEIEVLSDRCEVLIELGLREEAVTTIQTAISLFRKQNPTATHPPRLLLRRLADSSLY